MSGILLTTRHYPPDTAALAYRIRHVADVLSGHEHITVLTSQPSRYSDAKEQPSFEKRSGQVEIHRIWNGQVSKSRGKVARAVGEFFGAVWMTYIALSRYRHVDAVLVSSPPFAFLLPGWILHKRFGVPLYVDIRDLWLDWAEEIDLIPSKALVALLRRFEGEVLRSAHRVTVATKGFKQEIVDRFSLQPDSVTVIYNGLDSVVEPSNVADNKEIVNEAAEKSCAHRILYAGNLGPSQNIAGIMEGLLHSSETWPALEVCIVGDGLQRSDLIHWQRKRLQILGRVDRTELGRLYDSADSFLLHIANLSVYRKTVPSKIFEYAAYGKPIVCGVHGEAREICSQHADCYFFDSDDPRSLENAIDRMIDGHLPDNFGEQRADNRLLYRSARAPLWISVFGF